MDRMPDFSHPGSSHKAQRKTAHKDSIESEIMRGYGTVPPQAIPLEEAVLGALMIDREALTDVLDLLTPDAFYTKQHQTVFRAIMRIYDRDDPIDILTVTEELRKHGELDLIGGSYYLTELTNRVASSANIEYHSRIIIQKYIKRQTTTVGAQMVKSGFDETQDCFETLQRAEQDLFGILQNTISRSTTEVSSVVYSTLKEIEQSALKASGGDTVGVPTGIAEMDEMTGGLHDSDLIILAARPGMGKTGLALTEAMNAAERQIPVAFFSLEMSNKQLVARMLSMYSGVSGHNIRNAKLEDVDWMNLTDAAEKIQGLKIYMDDTPSISLPEVRAKCRRLKRQHNIKLVIIDYLQLMKLSKFNTDNKFINPEQEVAGISKGLKEMAKELGVPVVALSQLSRAVEARGGAKRPQLSDLRYSGAVEQDADVVKFIYRPEYYGIMEDEEGVSLKGIAEIIYAKNRHGDTDTVKIQFEKETTRFYSMNATPPFYVQIVANTPNKSAKTSNNPASYGGDAAFPKTEIKPPSRKDEDIPF